ncbi:CCAAT enhancer binding protein alpha slow border cells [Oratosquilla oratoria]|uniref:CCAAT enhancer binding protein alpha slow border cells n=1 Tax=Oratosquilla oratoria TaxID=337810 RepID=UPI003F75C036
MESPHLYDSAEYKKASLAVKVKQQNQLFGEDYSNLTELDGPEISLDLHGLIDESQFSDSLIQDIQSLSVDKSHSPSTSSAGPRGLGANPVNTATHLYANNPLAYMPQPVHGGSQFGTDRLSAAGASAYSPDGRPVKEEPQEHEYACSRLSGGGGCGVSGGGPGGVSSGNSGGGGGVGPMGSYMGSYGSLNYTPLTPTTLPGADIDLRSPMKSPTDSLLSCKLKKNPDKGTDEYKRRRERNNIAVRKSREKAKARNRETEERVKHLTRENDRLQKKCDYLSKEITMFRSMFSNVHLLPESVQREVGKHLDMFKQQHQHLLNM